MEHLPEQMDRLGERLRRVLLLSDYDGTLTPIVERPELATLSPEMKAVLKSVSRSHRVVVISGRGLSEVKKLVGLGDIFYGGNHGFEIKGPGVEMVHPGAERLRPIVGRLSRKLRERLKGVEGAIVQDKWLTVSVHYRLVGRGKVKTLEKIVDGVTEPHVDSGAVKLTRGKKVIEVRPNVDWDKGKAARWIIETLDPKGELTPVYLGDDATDENAFRELKRGGITVLVSENPRRSNAEFFLRDVKEVENFLRKIAG